MKRIISKAIPSNSNMTKMIDKIANWNFLVEEKLKPEHLYYLQLTNLDNQNNHNDQNDHEIIINVSLESSNSDTSNGTSLNNSLSNLDDSLFTPARTGR